MWMDKSYRAEGIWIEEMRWVIKDGSKEIRIEKWMEQWEEEVLVEVTPVEEADDGHR